MSAITVTIGRNVGESPMSVLDWDHYVGEARAALTWAGDVVTDAAYIGEWEEIKEDAHIFHVVDVHDHDVDFIRKSLALLASHYNQDAVGFLAGNGELLSASAI